MIQIVDDLGNKIKLEKKPERIISLVPSVTKTVADLGGRDRLIAVTNFCKYPEELIADLPKVGGPKKVKTRFIEELNPDLILAVKEENNKEQIELLQQKFPVIVFDVNNVGDAFRMIEIISEILGNPEKGTECVSEIKQGLASLPGDKRKKAIYLIWKEPWMAAGKETFIGSMMHYAGLENIIPGRYPTLNLENLNEAQTVLLSSEPFHFTGKHQKELRLIFPEKNIVLVDGEMFTWYGTMMKKAVKYFEDILNETH